MSNLKTQKENLIDFLLTNYQPGQKWKDVGEKFGFEAEQARKIWLNYRQKNNVIHVKTTEEKNEDVPVITSLQEDIKSGNAEMTISNTQEIKDLKDLSKLIDTDKWEIVKYVQNFWNNKYQVKAWLEPKTIKESEVIENLLKNYKSNWSRIPKAQKIVNKIWESNSCLVINLNDLHFDKTDLDESTIEDNISNYFKVLEYLVGKAYHSAKLDEIVFVIGNDIFNTDNIQNTTTNGTPQSVNTTWNNAYEKVFDAMVQSITMLSNYASKVHCILVQGNHDRTKSFYLAHALQTYFQNDPSITWDRSTDVNKSYVYGNTFLGFNHGNNINDKLPLAFAQEFYKDWGLCKYHDILISDKHHNNEKIFNKRQTQNDGFQGVKLRILPSLSKPDRWHDDNLFRSRQSGIAILYDYERGKSAEFEYQL